MYHNSKNIYVKVCKWVCFVSSEAVKMINLAKFQFNDMILLYATIYLEAARTHPN